MQEYSRRLVASVAEAMGSIRFFYANLLWFLLWIGFNLLSPWHFDPFPFQFLTLAVSLEAIFLSICVLIVQNQQAEADRAEVRRDAQTNLKAAQEIHWAEGEVRELMDHMHRQDGLIQEILTQLQSRSQQ